MSKEIENLIVKLHPLERKVLPYTAQISSFHELVSVSGLQEVEVMRALQWLQNKGLLIIKEIIQEVVELDKNGQLYFEKGLPEKRFLKVLVSSDTDHAVSISSLKKEGGLDNDEMTICLGLLKRSGMITLKKEAHELFINVTERGRLLFKKETDEEKFIKSLELPRNILDLLPEEKTILLLLNKRKNIVKTTVVKLKSVILRPLGQQVLAYDLTKEYIEQLTPDMLKSGTWKHNEFRHYDVSINVPAIAGGKQHILTQAIAYIKHIWLDIGFVEMTGPLLQISYWDLDCLFVPQDHPARQMQDTFFITDETEKRIALGKLPDDFKKIKSVHESGGKTGSTGWKTLWKEEEAQKVLLRTHTTVLSALKLAELGKDQKTVHKKLPLRFFNVGRVFRNEALNWKHLFEFHQIDGIVIDPTANMKNLKAYLRQFFGKMGYADVRIRPAYFPYTEPSMEVEVWHSKKKQWIEFGGAGIFRPEVVIPLLGVDIPVLAWGLGLERIISEYYHLTDIRDLYKNDLKQLQQMKMWIK